MLFSVFLKVTALQVLYDGLIVLCYPKHTDFTLFIFFLNQEVWESYLLLSVTIVVCMVTFLYLQQTVAFSFTYILLPRLHKVFLTKILKFN